MSLDITITERKHVWDRNITHNLGKMAAKCGLYLPLWRPEEINVKTCADITPLLKAGLFYMERNKEELQCYNAENGWGEYENLLELVRDYLKVCEENPHAEIEVSR